MTKLLEQAIAELNKLPAEKQDDMAAVILDDLNDDKQWEDSFAKSQDALSRWAQKVRDDIRAGRVRSGGMDEL